MLWRRLRLAFLTIHGINVSILPLKHDYNEIKDHFLFAVTKDF